MAILIEAAAAVLVLAILLVGGRDYGGNAFVANATVDNFLRYQTAVAAYYSTHPSSGPVVPDASLGLPPTFSKIRNWSNLRNGTSGPVFVFGAGDATLQAALTQLHARKYPSVGIVTGGRIVSSLYGDVGIAVPPAIPNGSFAAVVKLP